MPYIAASIILLAILSVLAVIYLKKIGKGYIRQGTGKENKLMFWIGIAVVVIAVIMFLTTKEEMENKMWAIPLWIMGIGLIANSQFRLFK